MLLKQGMAKLRSGLLAAVSSTVSGLALAGGRPAVVALHDDAAMQSALIHYVQEVMARHEVVGLSLALVDRQQLVWAHGVGYADAEAQAAATPGTLYRMGSNTKVFTDLAALQLVADGRLDLESPIELWLPELHIVNRHSRDVVTVRQLMTHHGGLPRDVLKGMWTQSVLQPSAWLNTNPSIELAYAPGEVFGYSNLGITLLGLIVERIAKRDLATHLRESVLRPLGMQTAEVNHGPAETQAAAMAYREGEQRTEPMLRDLAAGGLNASVLDLSRLLMMYFAHGQGPAGEVLPSALAASMWAPQNARVPLDFDLQTGFGWFLNDPGFASLSHAGTVASHGGATLYHRSQMVMLPELGLGVVVAANSAEASEAVNDIAREALQLLLQARRGLVRQEPKLPRFERAHWDSSLLLAYAGSYTSLLGAMDVERSGHELRARIGDDVIYLRPGQDGWLYPEARLFGLIPLPVKPLKGIAVQRRFWAGRELLLARVAGRELLFGERLKSDGLQLLSVLEGRFIPQFTAKEVRLLDHVDVFSEAGLARARLWPWPVGEKPHTVALRPESGSRMRVLGALADRGEVVDTHRHATGVYLEFAGLRFDRDQP